MNYGVFPHETLFYNVICDFTTCVGGGIYEQESITVGCVPSAAVAVGGWGGGGELLEGYASRGIVCPGGSVCSGASVCQGAYVCPGGVYLPRANVVCLG